MKIKKNFVLQQIVDEYIVVPVAEEADRLKGVIKLNEIGAILWKRLADSEITKEELEKFIMDKYNIEQSKAHHDVGAFICQIEALGCLEV